MKNKDAIKLFLTKEYAELCGKRNFNLWVLTAIFCVSIFVIGFGSASMKYLSYKMDDPFINWVDINLDQQGRGWDKEDPQTFLKRKEVQERFRFVDPQPNFVHFRSFCKKDGSGALQFDGRSIAAYSYDQDSNMAPNPILEKILDRSNVVERRDIPLNDNDLGVIITAEMAKTLGYEESPAFVALWQAQDVEQCEMMGLGGGIGGNYPVWVPVVAIVHQLPGMNAFLFTSRYWREIYSNDPFSPILDENNEELLLCGSEKYLSEVKEKVEGYGYETELAPYMESWKPLFCLKVQTDGFGEERTKRFNELVSRLSLDKTQYVRIYNYRFANNEGGRSQYCSVRMLSLDSIRSFAEEIHERCDIKLEMTNIEAKENFNFVQRMGVVLSGSIIVIVALFIMVFIYFMLQSHFQKIQRNIGTFKAFGVDNRTLDRIYIQIILKIVVLAFAIGGAAAALAAWLWSLVSVIEDGFLWVDVIVWWNLLLFVLAVVAAVVASLLVSHRMLRKTPGDLIYDRG